MLSFPHRYNKAPQVPSGFILDTKELPSPTEINRLLSLCNLETHPPKRLELALEKTDCHLSILEDSSKKLFGFVRVTSDKGLNANLWDLCAEPGKLQGLFISILLHRTLKIIREDMPGCSISVAAPRIAIQQLQEQGFLLDPGGIRAMGFRI